MRTQDCVFCKILDYQLPAKIVAENDQVVAIEDIAPKAPVHYLIIPKKHVLDIQSLQPDDAGYAAAMLLMATHLSKKLSGSQACKLIMNNGPDAGQKVFHLHCHFLAGKKMQDF
jgi:histidine triad (HIT) family protein